MLMSMKTTIEKYYGREDSQSKEVTNSWDKTQSLVCMQSTDHFYITDLILKLNGFFYQSYFPYGGQNGTSLVPVPCKSNGKEKEFEYYFLRNCRNWNLVKKKNQ